MGLFDVASKFSDLDECTCASCGVLFASPVISERRKDGKSLFCPNGHILTFGTTEIDRVRAENARLKQDRDWQRSQRETVEKRLISQKGLTTKAKKKLARVHAGVCPECNRTFSQLAAHMHTKHPELTPEVK